MAVWLAVPLSLALLPVTLARVAGGAAGTPLPQLAAFAPWAVLGWSLAVLLFVLARRWRPLAAVLVALALHLWWLVPPSEAREEAVAAGAGAGIPVRVMTVNARLGQADPDAIVEAAAARDVDVLSVQELNPPLAAALERRLAARFPHRDLHPDRSAAAGTGIWSRWPLRPLGLVENTFRTPQVRISVPGAGRVTVTAVHPVSPRRGTVGEWNRDLDLVGAAVRPIPGPQIVLGDFNATRDHHGFRELLRTGLIDAADAVGLPWTGFTWPADHPRAPVAVRIDHVLVTPEHFTVQDADTEGIAGTDHRAVVAELTLRP